MKSKVTITANPQNGQVFTPNAELGKDGKRYGFIRLEQTILDFSGAVARSKKVSALKSMLEDDYNKAKDFLKQGTEMPGTIIAKETLDPSLKGYQAKMAGSGDKAIACLSGTKPIFRTTEYVTDVNAEDVLIQHTNVEEIKAANKAAIEAAALNAK